mgnify:CR=1 FL=1
MVANLKSILNGKCRGTERKREVFIEYKWNQIEVSTVPIGSETLRVLARLIARRLQRELAKNEPRGHTMGSGKERSGQEARA